MSAIEPGTLFANRFEIERLAGTGGMGAVYRARDRYTGAFVALKLMHQGGAGSEGAERFEREARLLAELSHPGVVSHVAHGQTPDGRRFLAMEWLDGEDLAARLARGPLPLGECVALLRDVAAALDVAHRRGIVHRDLKPSNLFLVGGDVARAKVLDFGIARRTAASQAMTRTGTMIGTPDYMAPEQARGGREITPAADVFSLGCVLYECLAGRPPFVAEHLAAVLARILFEDPAPVEALRPDVPAGLSALIGRMLAKYPDGRPADAGALGAALDALGELGSAAAPTIAVRPAPASSFAEREQALFSLVVAWPPAPTGSDVTVLDEETRVDAARQSTVRSALAALGLSADFMADGSLMVKVLGTGSATNQAAHAARAALVIKDLWPAAEVALATGRGAVEGPFTMGEVADRAVRLLMATDVTPSEPDTRPGVRLDELSARLLGPRFALTPSPEGALLTGQEKDADTSRRLLGKPTPCVGREAELGSLEAQIAGAVESSEARAVLVTAPPGAGKSRLRHELLRRLEKQGEPVTLLAGRGDAMSAGAPYGILAAAVRALAGVGGGEPIEEQRRRLHARVGQHVVATDRERVVRFVGEMCDVPFPDDGLPMLQTARQEPKIMGDCLRRAVLDWLAAECAVGPVLVVLDDLHWGDALTVSVMDDALREQAGAPLFVLALGRPEVHEAFPRLWHRHKMAEIALRGLSRKACERLIREVLGKDVPPATVDRVVAQSAGNALFLEELIRSIAEETAEDQPATVVAMLQARIGRLPTGPRRALQAASVFGPTFWSGGVAAVLGLPGASAEVTGWLSALLEAELIQPSPTSRLHDEEQHGFQHALVRDAAYGLLTASDLATGHRLAGEFLEAAGEHDAAVVAEHLERGGDAKKAAGFYLRAAEESLERGDYAGAQRLCARGEAGAPEGEVLGRLKSVVCYAGVYLNSYAGTGEAALSAMTLLRPGNLGWCRALLAAVFAAITDPSRLFELLGLLGSTDPEPDARLAYIEAQANVSPIMAIAPAPMVEAYLERLSSSVELASETIPAVRRYFLATRGYLTIMRAPRAWSAMRDLDEAARLAREVGDQKTELSARLNGLEIGWLEVGDREGARRRMLALEETLARHQEVMTYAGWSLYLAWILCEDADPAAWDEAEARSTPLLSDTSGIIFIRLAAHSSLARVALQRGQLEKAEAMARAAMDMIYLAPLFWMGTAPVHIRTLIALGRAPEACQLAEQATGALQMLGGAGCYEMTARLAIVEAFEAGGDRARARAELAETLRQIALRAGDITDPLWRESFLTKNPSCVTALALGQAWGVAAREAV